MGKAPLPVDRGDQGPGARLSSRIEKNILVVLGGIVIGAFLAGIGAMVFVQKLVKAEIEDNWKGQIATLGKSAVDAQIKERFGTAEPALVKHFRTIGNDCTRVNDTQYCWGRETKTPRWDATTLVNVVDHSFAFAAPFDGAPVVTVGIYPAGNQKMWAVYSVNRTSTTFQVRAQDISRSPRSEEHVFVTYVAIGSPAPD